MCTSCPLHPAEHFAGLQLLRACWTLHVMQQMNRNEIKCEDGRAKCWAKAQVPLRLETTLAPSPL